MYPVKGTKGFVYCLSFEIALAATVLEKSPKMTGCCAVSPSKKKPKTVSPGDILMGLLRPALPEPDSGDINTCAYGNSSFFNSISLSG